ncbi:hypothetical protein V1285_003845 [Bradyrhizobium sp. AZCC 1620]
MGGDQRALSAQHAGQDLLHIIGQRARQRILQAFAAGRRHVVGAAPDQHLVLAPFLAGVILVEARQVAVVAFVEREVFRRRQSGLPDLGEHQLQRMLRPCQVRGEGNVERQPLRLQLAAGLLGLGNALFGEIRVLPAGEQVFQIPFTLPVTHEHKKTFAH